jgi:lactate dehydrogenase-like 2-hydroxyacid dehydrogenase
VYLEKSMSRTVLVLVETIDEYLPIITQHGFEVLLAKSPQARAAAIAEQGSRFDAVLTRGPLGLSADEMDALPNLKIICVLGAGYERVDLAAARIRGLTVTNGAGVNAPSVADHAMALLFAVVRDIPRADASVRRGEWAKITRPTLEGKRMGILGLGSVGMAIAKRAALGFDMHISYHNRRSREDVAYDYYADPVSLAADCDFLVVATPGGTGTAALVDSAVLEALGEQGFLINIARASVVDTGALLKALQEQRIAGAGLDVFDDEPQVPDALKALANVVLTPHVAGLSPQASQDTVQRVADNLCAFFSGRPVLTPVPLPD